MKLIELYIENFGGLSHYTLRFEAGITTVMESNGFGKTTIAEFIRAMLYGFPRKSKTLDKSRRQKYAPWNGGQYGGNLIFEYEGQLYRVERTFSTSPKGDTLTVIDLSSGRKTTRFGEEPGLELFGLDADSFARSTYLPQTGEEGPLATASILSKLSDLVEDGADVGNYDRTVAALRAKRSALIPYRGSGGTVAETAAQITRLQLQLDTARGQEAQLRAAQEEAARSQQEVERIKELLAQTGEQLHAASQQEADILRRQQYVQLQSRRSKAEDRLRYYEKKYPRGLPQEERLRRAEVAADRLRQIEKSDVAANTAVTAEELDYCRRLCAEYGLLKEEARGIQRRMADVLPTENACPETALSGRFKAAVAAVITGVAVISAGAALAFMQDWAYGFAVIGIGALLLIFGIVAAWMQKRKQHVLEERLRRQQLEGERKLSDLRHQADAVNRASEKCRLQIDRFLEQHGLTVVPAQYSAALLELERQSAQAARREADADAARKELQTLFEDMGIPSGQDFSAGLQQLREDLREFGTARMLVQALTEQLAAMEETCGDALFAEMSATQDPQQLRREEQQLRAELTAATTRMLQFRQRVQWLREETMQIPDLQERLKLAQQRMAEDREKAELLDTTIEFLQQAKENLTTAYMGTIRSRFGHYLSMLGDGEEKYLVDTTLQVQLERQGQTRDLAYFSAGQADLVMLCMRLALVDALFKGRETIVILDDPFVNLDDVHMEKTRRLLRTLACGHQILYLTCHSSRTV